MATIAVPPLRHGRSTPQSTRPHRAVRRWALLSALGVGAAFAWFTLSLFSGPSAHAADDTDNPLGSLVSSVSQTLSTVTTPVLDPVAEVLSPVTETVAPVVGTVAAPVGHLVSSVAPALDPLAPVGEVVAPLGSAVGEIVSPLAPVVAPVTDAVKPVVDAATPVTDAVTSLPVVGELVTPITQALPPLGGTQPSTGGTTSPTDPTDPSLASPSASGALALLTTAWDQAMHGLGATIGAGTVSFATAVNTFVPGAAAVTAPASLVSGAPGAPGGGWGLPTSTLEGGSFFSSGGGSSFGASAILAFGLFAAHRAWVRRRGPGAESALPAPVFDTDVSPD